MRFALLVIAALWTLPATAQAVLIDAFEWQEDDPRFGGFSGIELGADGRGFIAVSDRGTLAQGQITRSNDAITSVTLNTFVTLRYPNRVPLNHNQRFSDSEGLALAPDGSFYVSFEGAAGVRFFADATDFAGPLLTAPEFERFQNNAAFEAAAIDAGGALFVVPERSGSANLPFPVFRLQDGIWDHPFTIPRVGSFLITGADIGPDNRFYIVERDFLGLGFRNRVRSFDMDGKDERTILNAGLFVHDNLEGISVWQDDVGLRMTLISDDNFRRSQRTQIVEYRLTGK